jgi:hypothetical protein
MKTYYKCNDELASAWVAGKCSDFNGAYTDKRRMIAFNYCGVHSNFTGTIQSYGSHFTIAKEWKAPDTGRTWYLVTERTYSPTTRRHVQVVSRAVPSDQRVYLPQVDNLTDLATPELKRLVPDLKVDLTSPEATESQLGLLVLHHATLRLDYQVTKYLRATRPFSPEYLDTWFNNSEASVARFKLTLPARFHSLRDQCAAHYHHRAARNAELDATLPARRRLIAA